ncbi:hypothetical protein O5511_12470 [Escherichia coli]|nr:hypothetical protein [Escherichia coli]
MWANPVLDYKEKPHDFTVKNFELKTLYADSGGSPMRKQETGDRRLE